jgi:hypothetical protein
MAEAHWEHKLRTVCGTLANLGWPAERARRLHEGFLAHLRDPATFSYSVLITVKGIVRR